MKKILTRIFVLSLFSIVLSMAAFAADATIYTEAQTDSAMPGSSISFDLYLSGTYDGFSFTFKNTSDLTFTGITRAQTNYMVDTLTDGYRISVIGGLEQSNAAKAKIATVNATINTGSTNGKKSLSISKIELSSEIGDPVAYDTVYDEITVGTPTVAVTGVTLNKTATTLTVGETETLTATVSPSNATNKSVTWSTSNASVATVSNGKITAKAAGTATITVKTADGNKTATCAVTVKAATVAVTGVSLNKTATTLTVGETETLTATVSPSNATNKSVTWSTSNASVATVSNGKITAKAAGTATITVKTADGNKTATCKVTVNKAAEKPDDTKAAMIIGSIAKTTAGGKATVTVSLKNNPGITSAKVKIDFDSKVLTLVEVKDAGVLGSNMHLPTLTSPYTLYWFNGTATENYTVNGTVATLTFEVKKTAAIGTYPITVTATSGDIYNVDLDEVAFQTVSGGVEVIDLTLGDINGDGRVNVKDNMVLARHLAGWDGYGADTINLAAADLNADGEVNVKDSMILARHLAKWFGYDTLPKTK